MNRLNLYLLSFMLCLPTGFTAAQGSRRPVSADNGRDDSVIYHIVERGQTIYSIAALYKVSESDIYRLNPKSRDQIREGETLKIPRSSSLTATASGGERAGEQAFTDHIIRSGETLYSLAKNYDITPEDITNANPGLEASTFYIGKTIRIPAPTNHLTVQNAPAKEEYTIKKNETIYGLCRRFGTDSEELIRLNPELRNGLRAGMVIKVPEKKEVATPEPATPSAPSSSEYDIEAMQVYRNEVNRVDVARVALLLPFQTSDTKNVSRFVEYYEGFLMAIDSLRRSGNSIDLSVYDLGDGVQKTREVLRTDEVNAADLIIGGVTDEQIEMIADYASKKGVKYVIPLSSKLEKLTSGNAFIFQVNTPKAYLASIAAARACSLLVDYNAILINTGDKEEERDFVHALKTEMTKKGITYREVGYNSHTFRDDLAGLLSTSKPNAIIPASSSADALAKLRPTLRSFAQSKSDYRLTLFGYPEWQTYTNYASDFSALNTYIYTPFYANIRSSKVKHFTSRYKSFYQKNMHATYPRYAMLGFDTGMYFIGALQKHGANFEENIRKMKYNSVQMGLYYNERMSNWGGFMNQNIYIVHYNKDNTVTREE